MFGVFLKDIVDEDSRIKRKSTDQQQQAPTRIRTTITRTRAEIKKKKNNNNNNIKKQNKKNKSSGDCAAGKIQLPHIKCTRSNSTSTTRKTGNRNKAQAHHEDFEYRIRRKWPWENERTSQKIKYAKVIHEKTDGNPIEAGSFCQRTFLVRIHRNFGLWSHDLIFDNQLQCTNS